MANGSALKIQVLGSGEVLLNGEPAALLELDQVFAEAREEGTPVQFERANSESTPSLEAQAVLNLIRMHRLRLSLTSPTEIPAPEDVKPREVAKVVELPVMDTLFAKLRRQSAQIRGISLLRPDRSSFVLPAPAPGTIPEQMIAMVTALVPPR